MAGFFGLFNYSKPGKGVYKNEPERSHFVKFWVLVQRKFWNLLQLNLLYLLFCIPIVTIGPATCGMTYILRQYANEQPVFLVSDFWDNFKQNFKQGLVFGLIQIIISVVLTVSIQFYFMNVREHAWMYVALGLCFLVALITTFISYYVYLMIVTLDLPLKNIIKNGFIFAVLGVKRNFITLFFTMLVIIPTALFFPVTSILIFCIIITFCSFIICYNSYPLIKKMAIDPYLEQLREQGALQEKGKENVFSDAPVEGLE